jgi:hypothetical protein
MQGAASPDRLEESALIVTRRLAKDDPSYRHQLINSRTAGFTDEVPRLMA